MSKIAAQRLYNQQIAQPRFEDAGQLLMWLGAIQGQDYAGAKWSLGLRLPGSTDADIEQAMADKTIVRTWVMRGTLHLVAGADVRWMVDLLGDRLISRSAPRYRQLELDEATLQQSNDILLNALAGHQLLSRKTLFGILEEKGISTRGQRGIHLLQRASLDGLICQGAAERNNPNFMRMDEAFPDASMMARDESLAELARRYFTSRGHATLQDFAWWSALPMADVRAGFEAVKAQLVEDVIDGVSYWLSPESRAASSFDFALPGFDEYLLGYKDRSAVLDPENAEKVCPGQNGMFFPTMVIDGRMVGTWKRSFKKGQVIISPQPFEPLSAEDMERFIAVIQPFGDFLQMPLVVEEW